MAKFFGFLTVLYGVLIVTHGISFGRPHRRRVWVSRNSGKRLSATPTKVPAKTREVSYTSEDVTKMKKACVISGGNSVVADSNSLRCDCTGGYIRQRNPEKCVKKTDNKIINDTRSAIEVKRNQSEGSARPIPHSITEKELEIARLRNEIRGMKYQDFVMRSRIRMLKAIAAVRISELRKLKEEAAWINDYDDKTKAVAKQKKKYEKPTQPNIDKLKASLKPRKINEKATQLKMNNDKTANIRDSISEKKPPNAKENTMTGKSEQIKTAKDFKLKQKKIGDKTPQQGTKPKDHNDKTSLDEKQTKIVEAAIPRNTITEHEQAVTKKIISVQPPTTTIKQEVYHDAATDPPGIVVEEEAEPLDLE